MFVTETMLAMGDVRDLLEYCRGPYEKWSQRPATSPHARFDIVEWVPLDM